MFSFHLPELMLSLWLCLEWFMLLIQSSGCFHLFLQCLLLAVLSIAFPCRLGGLGFFLRLSCLNLVIVLRSRLFLHPLGLVYFPLFIGLHCLFSASLLSVVLTFGSPEVSFLFVCCLLLSVAFSLYSASFSFAAVALPCSGSGFPFSLSGNYYILLTCSPVVVSLLSFSS